MKKKALRVVLLLVCLLCAMPAATHAQQQRRVRRSGGLDNLSLPSTGVSIASSSWREVAPEGTGFSVMMPGSPVELTKDLGQGGIAMRVFNVKADEMEYAAGVVQNFPGELMQQPGFATSYFKMLPDVIVESVQYREKHYRLSAQRPVSIRDYPGRQYRFDSADYTCVMRVYLGEQTVYTLIVESPKAAVSDENLEKFFSSFDLKEN